MTRYYHPETMSEVTENFDSVTNKTSIDDMPAASKEWFTREVTPGKEWVNDPTGRFPIEQDIPPPTQSEQEATERAWAQNQLRRTDFIILPDSPYTEPHRQLVKTYRAALRNPTRTTHATFPAQTWRPTFPAGVKEPD